MTPQEQQMLQGLADRINNTQLSEKDPDAEQFLRQALGLNPDAIYILAQTVLVQQYALDQAQKQLTDARSEIDQLHQQEQQPKRATSFLGGLLGHSDPPPPPPQQSYAPVPYSPTPYTPVSSYPPGYAPGYAQGYAPGYGAAPPQGGFLRGAMQTAAGVAAGALAFEGVESLMHGFGHAAGYGSGFGSGIGGFGEQNRPEEVINNYYGDSSPHEHSGNLSPDIEDRRGEDSSRFSQAVENDDHGDQAPDQFTDDSSNYDSSNADDSSGGFDDSGSDSGGGGDDNSF